MLSPGYREVFVTVNGIRRGLKDHVPVAEGTEFVPASANDVMTASLPEESKRRLIANHTTTRTAR